MGGRGRSKGRRAAAGADSSRGFGVSEARRAAQPDASIAIDVAVDGRDAADARRRGARGGGDGAADNDTGTGTGLLDTHVAARDSARRSLLKTYLSTKNFGMLLALSPGVTMIVVWTIDTDAHDSRSLYALNRMTLLLLVLFQILWRSASSIVEADFVMSASTSVTLACTVICARIVFQEKSRMPDSIENISQSMFIILTSVTAQMIAGWALLKVVAPPPSVAATLDDLATASALPRTDLVKAHWSVDVDPPPPPSASRGAWHAGWRALFNWQSHRGRHRGRRARRKAASIESGITNALYHSALPEDADPEPEEVPFLPKEDVPTEPPVQLW